MKQTADSQLFVRSIIFLFVLLGIWTQPLQAANAPDLVVSSVDAGGVTFGPGERDVTGTVSATITNTGAADTGAGFIVLFFEDKNGNGSYDSGSDIVLGSTTLAALAAGTTVVAGVEVSGTVSFRGNLMYAYVDSANAVAESDEANNYSNTGLACQFEPVPGTFNPVLEWSWTKSTVYSDYLNVMMTPGIIDLNGDGAADVIFASTSSRGGGSVEVGVLRALSGADGSELFTVTDSSQQVNTASSVAVGDIDGDGKPEIVACDSTGSRLIAFEHNGAYKWRSPTLEAVNWGAPSLADLDHDGVPEIIAGRQVLNNDGTIRWTGTGGKGSQGIGPLSLVADINMDGTPEIVAGNSAYTASGSVLWTASALPDGYNAAADFDGDGYPEIVLVSGGKVRLLEHDGTVKWGPVSIPGAGAGGPPTVADYDNDGKPEVGVAGASRYVVFETDGSIKWQAVTQDSSSNRTGSSVFDFDGDGSAEVVYRDELKLRVYRGSDGTVLFETPMSSCTWHEYPLIADVDNDGNAEIVAVANNNCGFGTQRGIYVYGDASDSWVATREVWNQHTYHITNINDDGSIPANERNNWEFYNNYRQNVKTGGSVFAAPDLTATFLGIDEANCPGSAGITARIGNGGSNIAAAPVKVAFYEGDPAAGGRLLGVMQTTNDLMPGQYEDMTYSLSPVIEGSRTICVSADDDGTGTGSLSECNETNNRRCVEVDALCNRPPQCSGASLTPSACWPPDHTFSMAQILGVTDPDAADQVTITVTGVSQDEPVKEKGTGSGNTAPDAVLVDLNGDGSPEAVQLRCERAGNPKTPGNGRTYEVTFSAADGKGGQCTGKATFCVPHDQRPDGTCIDDGLRYDSFIN
jgi:hypothetical protein